VLFAVREDLHAQPGGDTVQIVNTAKALRRLGVAVTISSEIDGNLSEFDCLHLWHLQRVHETYVHFHRARLAGMPVILSPIYWPWGNFLRYRGKGRVSGICRCREDIKNVVRYILAKSGQERQAIAMALKAGWAQCRWEMLELSSMILPNSHAEARMIVDQTGSKIRYRVVPNGVDVAACKEAFNQSHTPRREGILCVGYFDPRKNQLGLIRAMKGTGLPITFVGGARRMHRRYFWRCRRLAGHRMRFLGRQNYPNVLRLMREAVLHVCPSQCETPGLANLEAAAMGCGLAITDCPPLREYFEGEVFYFRSEDPDSIRSAVMSALEAPVSETLAAKIMANYTWERAATETLASYREVTSRF